jgi:hypothetical protein
VRVDGAIGESNINSPGCLAHPGADSLRRRTGSFSGPPGGASDFAADALRGGGGAAGGRDDEDGDVEDLHAHDLFPP